MALYNKYRPQSLRDICGQDYIKVILSNQVSSDTIAHSYLFTGPAGTGKTTVARIMGAMINCSTGMTKDPPKEDPFVQTIMSGRSHVDISEVDAASQRGIEDTKRMRETAYCPPIEMRKRFFVIDECHQLTSDAWAVLLKLLEEPPGYSVFILCTTDINKVPETIQTRCQCFTFRPLKTEEICSYIRNIASLEKIPIEVEAARLVAVSAQGSLRDALSKLDKIKSLGKEKIDLADVSEIVGVPSRAMVKAFVSAAVKGNFAAGLTASTSAIGIGVPAREFVRETAEFCHDMLLCDAPGFDFERGGYSSEDAANMPRIRHHLVGQVGQDGYRRLIREWIRILNEAYEMSVFNLQPQLQVNVAFFDLAQTYALLRKKYEKEAAATPAPATK